ncbi:MAG: peptidase M13 [Alteromonas sp.]|jgi:putative endopeptidase|uniref:M13 family metallopeptidase n=1 Tax=Alteromonas australica TaxID=589873 RepID=UPI000C5C599A|nr:M13 family metallopeptidase [Alteromonas australica]MAO31050.1 peptidase M13 [Alteromonas sp.]|tara:strand:+ start:1240 stop:3330 length:2091 start_codon:yes stop_codon:yes gene_type:complete
MKKTLLAATIAASLGLIGCSQPENTEKSVADKAAMMDAQNAELNQAELGSFGVDLSARNEAIKPGDEFFMYASGTWYDNYELPADKTRYGAFTALAERSEERVKNIVDGLLEKETLNDEEKLVHDFFVSYMDTDAINEKGLSPISDVLTTIGNISTQKDLTEVFGNAWLTGASSPINSGMWYNRLDPNEYQLSVGVGGLGLPDRDYYLSDDERFVKIREAYEAHIAQMLGFAKVENPEEKAAEILALETEIANVQWPREKRRDRDLTLNQIERAKLSDDYPNFDWDTYFAQTGYKVPELNISQPEPVKAVIEIINDTALDKWKSYLTYHTIKNNAGLLSEDIYLANFDFYGTTLSGQQEPRPRWKRAVSQMSGTQSLGFAIGKIYVNEYFPESSKTQMAELVENLRTALGQRIDNLDWMSEETKVNAKEKLMAFRPKIGYPDTWQSFEGLTIESDDLIGNVRNLREFFHQQSIEKELEKTDRERWGMTPQQVNAYYNSSFNEIVFPAAILQPPFFDPNADPAVNYGAIGAVIGHEMGHGFDDQGSKSDANGIQRNWWTDADRAAFEAKADKLAAQYSQYEPIEGNFVNGRNSLGENIGDVGGLAMAYHAYKLSLDGKEAPVIDGLTGDQRFFLAWAQVWREKRTEQSMLNQLRAGTHAPGRFRAQAPRNHDAWYEAFDVQPGDELYLAPEERVRIW